MSRKAKKILIAPAVRDALFVDETYFKGKGFRADVAPRDSDVVDHIRSRNPDLVVLMGKGTGTAGPEGDALCERLKTDERTRSLPVVLIVGDEVARETSAAKSDSEGAPDAVVPLSHGREGLLDRIGEILHIPIRRSVRITVMFSVHAWPEGKETLGRAVQISEGGMCLIVNKQFEEGADLLLRFMLPRDRQTIRSRANVRWVTPMSDTSYTLGLQFLEMDSEDRSRLSGYIAGRLAAVPA